MIREGQSIFDVVAQNFGTLENLSDFLDDNPQLTINSKLSGGQEQITVMSQNKGNEEVKKYFVGNNFVLNNNQDNASIGAYNDDYNNDYN